MKNHCKPKPLCSCIGRKCMKCQKMFMSIGDRICETCQKKNHGLSVMGGRYVAGSRRLKSTEDH